MIDVFQVANAMALTSTCPKCKEGAVLVDNRTGNVVAVSRSYCTCNSTECNHDDFRKCPCFVSAVGDLFVQGTEQLKETQLYVVSDKYPNNDYCYELSRLLSLCGCKYSSFNKIGAKLSSSSRRVVETQEVCCSEVDSTHKLDNHALNTEQTTSKTKTYGTATCPTCGNQFVKRHWRQKYCESWKIGVCDVCHKVFQYRCDSKHKTKPHTCSKECSRVVSERNLRPGRKG